MRGYVETMERLAYSMPEGREPTDSEIRSAMPRNPYARPVGEYVKEAAMKNLHVHPLVADALNGFLVVDLEEIPGRDDQAASACILCGAREPEPHWDDCPDLDDLVNANLRQMAGPWPIADKDGD